jgi:hypothetical protein
VQGVHKKRELGGIMDSPFYVSGFAMITAIAAPWIMAGQLNRNNRKVKEEDYRRSDAVAARAADDYKALLGKQEEVAAQAREAARLLAASTKEAQESAHLTEAKLDQIHTLVNSNLTAAIVDQLDARKTMLTLLLETVESKKLVGSKPSPETLEVIAATKIKVAELEAQVADRMQQTNLASAKLAVDLKKLPT